MDDTELIRKAKQGDGTAIRALYQRHSRRVFAIVRRVAGEDALAEDWAQEAWVRAIRALPTFRGDSQFTTWLHRIAVNSALHGKRGRDRRAGREAPLPEDGPGPSVAPAAERTVLRMKLQAAIDQLPEGMRRVLVLHDVEGYTHEEIGAMLGAHAGTCKSQLFKARARMRRLLTGALDPAEGVETCNT